jgi:twitching motility protein PilJ
MISNSYQSTPETQNTQVSPPKLPQLKLLNFRRLNLQTKATLLAIALGTLPVITIGGIAYWVANKTLTDKIAETQAAAAIGLADKTNRFIFERYGDVQAVANLPILRNRRVQQVVPVQERAQVLKNFASFYGVYTNIVAFDLKGDVIVQAGNQSLENPRTQNYFQQVVTTNKPIFTQPEVISATGETVMYFAAPLRDSVTNEIVGVVRTEMPTRYIDDVIRNYGSNDPEYHLVDANGIIFLAKEKAQIRRELVKDLPGIDKIQAKGEVGTGIFIDQIDQAKQLVAYAPFEPLGKDLPNLHWSAVIAIDTKVAFALQQQLLTTIAIGTALTAAFVSLLAIYLVNRVTHPIQQAAVAVEKIGQGNLTTRLTVVGEDEIALLGSNINLMATQIENLVEEQKAEAERIEQARQEARQEADARAQEQQQAKEFLQKRALDLLLEVDPVNRGDLTIRATVTSDEIGTIADSYNAIIRSLRQIVEQVKSASQSVAETASNNESAVTSLSTDANAQMQAITEALQQIQDMVQLIQGVAKRAQQAESEVQVAAQAIQSGDEAMNRTVHGISTIRETVAETAKKVKRLGDASQKISKAVNLIGDFAAQTNLLALNAAIEAARAGEEGRGFAVVAEEVRSLAQQSAAATAEIEQLVEEIQSQTNEVVTAMEAGTEQVVVGTKLVEESRQKLSQITTVSQHINHLVKEISEATATQTETSQSVSQAMKQVSAIASGTSKQSEDLADSFANLLQVAQNLQVSIAQFKV